MSGDDLTIDTSTIDKDEYIQTAIESAADCALWQATDATEAGGHAFPVVEDDEYTERVIAEVPSLTDAVTAFVRSNWDTLMAAYRRKGYQAGQCGHDLILTANGHGTGFWDRGLGDLGNQLTDASEGYSMDAEFALDEDGDVAWLLVDNVVLVDQLGWSSEPEGK